MGEDKIEFDLESIDIGNITISGSGNINYDQ